MRILALAVVLGAALTVVAPAADAGDFCPSFRIMDLAGQAYLLHHAEVLEDGYLFWVEVDVALESNGQSGYQKTDQHLFGRCPTLLGDPDLCQDSPTPDTCIF